jgi:hypothetical protein
MEYVIFYTKKIQTIEHVSLIFTMLPDGTNYKILYIYIGLWEKKKIMIIASLNTITKIEKSKTIFDHFMEI